MFSNMYIQHCTRQTGFSLVGSVIAAGLLALLLSSNLNLLSFIASGSSSSNKDELLDQMTRLTEVFSSRVNRGGGSLSVEGDEKGIQLCQLNNVGSQCGAYSNQSTNFCLSLPTQLGNGALATIEVRGFRLLNGVLQQRSNQNVDMAKFDVRGFCTERNEWENLHNPEDFTLSELKLCRFKADSMQDITANYRQRCESILNANLQEGTFWIVLFEAKPANPTAKTLNQTRIIQLFNETRITTL